MASDQNALYGSAAGTAAGAYFGGPVGAMVGGSLGGAIGSSFGKKPGALVPTQNPYQQAAMSQLLNFSQTGKFGDFTAGAQVPLGYGDFNATSQENQGLSQLQQLLQGGIPSQYAMGDKALQDILGQGQGGIQAQFNPFQAQVKRQLGRSQAELKRGAGYAGSLYSTGTIKGLGDIQARGNETLSSQLANLNNEALNRKMQAIPLAYQSAEAQQGAKLQQIAASQQYGALTRQLNNASIQARDAELLRRRQELQLPIQAAQGILGAQTNYNALPIQQKSPYADLLGMVGQIGGQFAGGYAAGRSPSSGSAPASEVGAGGMYPAPMGLLSSGPGSISYGVAK